MAIFSFRQAFWASLVCTGTVLAFQPHSLQQQQHPRRRTAFITNSRRSLVTKAPTSLSSFQSTSLSLSATQSTDDTETNDLPSISLFNSKTRQKDPLVPVTPGRISMYTCGPTVYDYAHVGNFRAFLTYDLVKRVLQYYGYDVTHICNLTDVDDKIIQRATEQGLADVTELTRKFEFLFLEDLKALNIRPATEYPRATEHITDMMDMILLLRDEGLAYETSDGSWYFRTQAQPTYGTQLVQLNFDDMESTERGSAEEKEHFADFCLWKAFKEGVDREDAAWASDEIQKGRPGWHLECSAMARKFFGPNTIDLHGGGVDLKFPHHENEIAQSEGAACGTTFCNCWFHNGFVNIGDEKMSKSLGNFLTLRGACPTGIEVRAYRYLVISSQYRNPLAFTQAAMDASKNAITRIDKVRAQMNEALEKGVGQSDAEASDLAQKTVPQAMANFEAALMDDLSMPRASASLFSIVKGAENEFKRVKKSGDESTLDLAGLSAVLEAMDRMDDIFGIFYDVPLTEEEKEAEEDAQDDSVPEEVLQLVSERSAAKDAKDWELADSLRKRITELGFAVKDVKGGDPIVSRI